MARADATVQAPIDNGILTIIVQGFAPIVVDPEAYSQAIRDHGFLHGMKQRLVDAAALGADSTPAQKHAAIVELHQHMLTTGEWSRVGKGDGSGSDGLLAQAIAQFDGCTIDEARALCKSMDKKTQAAMRASPELKPIIDGLKVARKPKVAPVADVSAALARLRGMAPKTGADAPEALM